MQVVILLLLVAALALLVLGLTTASSSLVVVSIAVSLVAVVAIVRARQRRIARLTAEAAESRRLEKIEKDKDETTKVLAVALSKNRAVSTVAEPSAEVRPAARSVAAPKHQAAEPAETGIAADSFESGVSSLAETSPSAGIGTSSTYSEASSSVGAEGSPELEDADADDPAAATTRPPLTRHGADPVWVIDGRPRYHSWNCDFVHGKPSESVPLAQAVEDGFTPCSLCDPDTKLAAG